jgi:hypothetical protein
LVPSNPKLLLSQPRPARPKATRDRPGGSGMESV